MNEDEDVGGGCSNVKDKDGVDRLRRSVSTAHELSRGVGIAM